jgi:hypothetical protein
MRVRVRACSCVCVCERVRVRGKCRILRICMHYERTPPLTQSRKYIFQERAAAGIRRSTCSGAEAAYLLTLIERAAATISPPPTRRAASTARLTRLLLSSDLLRVVDWVAVGLCLGSGFALVVGGLLLV